MAADTTTRRVVDRRQEAVDLISGAWDTAIQGGDLSVATVQLAVAQVNALLYVGDAIHQLRREGL